MKHIKKINIIIIVLVVIGIVYSNYSYASELESIFSDADVFLSKGNSVSDTISEENLKATSNFMYRLLLAIGIIVMFIVGTILGIQFMIASAEDKAKVKEALVPYIVGCFVIFGAFTIWSIVVNIGQDTIQRNAIVAKYYCSDCAKYKTTGYCGTHFKSLSQLENEVYLCKKCNERLTDDLKCTSCEQ